jgi:hypothetical protein
VIVNPVASSKQAPVANYAEYELKVLGGSQVISEVSIGYKNS